MCGTTAYTQSDWQMKRFVNGGFQVCVGVAKRGSAYGSAGLKATPRSREGQVVPPRSTLTLCCWPFISHVRNHPPPWKIQSRQGCIGVIRQCSLCFHPSVSRCHVLGSTRCVLRPAMVTLLYFILLCATIHVNKDYYRTPVGNTELELSRRVPGTGGH